MIVHHQKESILLFDSLTKLAISERETLIEQVSSIQSRTGFIMASSSLVATIVPVIIVGQGLNINTLLLIGIGFYIITFLLSCKVLDESEYTLSPDIKKFYMDFKMREEEEIRENILAELYKSNTKNHNKLKRKVIWQKYSLIMLAVGTEFIFLGILLQIKT